MERNLAIVDELRAKLAEKPLDMEMIAGLKATLAAQPIDGETASALEALLTAQALDDEMMAALTALRREYMPSQPVELSDDELDNVTGGCTEYSAGPQPNVPGLDFVLYVVKASDQLDAIANSFKTTPSEIKDHNVIIKNIGCLRTGMKLWIPDRRK